VLALFAAGPVVVGDDGRAACRYEIAESISNNRAVGPVSAIGCGFN